MKILTDNIAYMYYINCQGGTKSSSLCTEAMKLWNCCISHNVTLSAAYLLSMQNWIQDKLSCKFPHNHEWEMHLSVLQDLFIWWGIPSTDLIGIYKNKMGEHSLGHVLLFPKDKDHFYAFPLFRLLLKVPLKVKRNRAHIILICSYMAKADLVPLPDAARNVSADLRSDHSSPPLTGQRTNRTSQLGDSLHQSMAPTCFQHLESSCSREVQEVLLHSRKSST